MPKIFYHTPAKNNRLFTPFRLSRQSRV